MAIWVLPGPVLADTLRNNYADLLNSIVTRKRQLFTEPFDEQWWRMSRTARGLSRSGVSI